MRSTRLLSWIERLAGLGPVPVPPHVFSIDPSWLRYGRFVRAEGGFELEAYAEAALPEGLFAGGPLGGPAHEPAALLAALDELLQAHEGVSEASIVLPDAWVRVAFVDLEETPRSAAKREEMLRWKLKRTVPFRIEDLRLDAVEVEPLAGGAPRRRWLLCFGVESSLAQIEQLFSRRGVRVGQIVPASLATAAAVHEVASGDEVTGLVAVSASGYSVTFLRRGEPLLHRFRPLGEGLADDSADALVVRDLKLTRTFLREHLPDAEPARWLLAAPPEASEPWAARIATGLDGAVVVLAREQMPLSGRLPERPMHRVAPLLGVACQEAA